MVMGVSCLNDIPGQIGLRQKRIGGNGFSLNINSIEKRDGSLDFVCLFFFVASLYR
jgi:hypothetical protein